MCKETETIPVLSGDRPDEFRWILESFSKLGRIDENFHGCSAGEGGDLETNIEDQ